MESFKHKLKWFEKFDGFNMKMGTQIGSGDIIITSVLDSCEDGSLLTFVGVDEQEFFGYVDYEDAQWRLTVEVPHYTVDCSFQEVYEIEEMKINECGNFEIICNGPDFEFCPIDTNRN